MRLINGDKLFEEFCNLEAQALDYVGKLIERDGEEPSEEWRIWSAILNERTAYKHDIFDAPTVDADPIRHGKWVKNDEYSDDIERHTVYECSECGALCYWFDVPEHKYCPNCGAKMDMDEVTE